MVRRLVILNCRSRPVFQYIGPEDCSNTDRLNELLEFFDEVFDFLGLGFVGDQGGVVGLDDDAVAEADDGDEGAVLGAGVEMR
jgi:hypothetical protein